MRFKSLADLRRREIQEVPLAQLPEAVRLTGYAKAKAFAVNELVRQVHKDSFEWYGYTLGRREAPENIVDIGLPVNDRNLQQHANLGPENIAAYQDSLPPDLVINGWIHSHGDLNFQHFSETDAANQRVVLDFVTTRLKLPLAKRELVIQDLALLVAGQYGDADLKAGSVSLITDVPVSQARILETVYGGFCYAIVVDDSGWHHQEIHYKSRGILSGQTSYSQKEADLLLLTPETSLPAPDLERLREDVREKIQPHRYVLPKLEGM